MQESTYFYEGKPLSQYCKEHDINVNTIRTRIWKMKHSKKYKDLSDEKIIDKVIKAYGKGNKYNYKGISLRQYCLENDLEYSSILSRINRLKERNNELEEDGNNDIHEENINKECNKDTNEENNNESNEKSNKKLSDDEIVALAIEKFENGNYRFFYGGMPLKEYCELHPEINYNTIRGYINREQEKNPKLTDEELIKKYIKKEHKGMYKYYYLGMPLIEYCFEANLNYKNIISYISRNKDNEEYKGLTDDELIAKVMDKYEPFEPKYLYGGTTLRAYCSKNDISYYSVVSYVKRKKAKGSQSSIDDLIDEAIKTIKRHGIIYYYKGIPLKDYCFQNKLNVSSIRQTILRKQVKSDKPLQEIVDECVESYQKFSIKYYYDGVPLTTFCKSINLNYNTVLHRYLEEYADRDDITTDEAIKQIVDYYLENPPIKRKYFFDDMSLKEFCAENGYPLFAIYNRLQTLKNNTENQDNDQLVATAVKKYEQKLHMDKLNEIFKYLEDNHNIELETLRNVCEFLKIDMENVIDLYNMDFSYYQSINIIWYFSDSSNNDLKTITDIKLTEVFQLVEKVKNGSNKEIEKMELYDLIAIYKCALYDSRSKILIQRKTYIRSVINRLCSGYKIEINKDNIADFKSEISLYLIRVISNCNSNIYGQIVKYLDISVKGYFRKYLRNYKPNNHYEEVEELPFNEKLIEVLIKLPNDDINFVILRFQEDYSDEALSEFFNITLEDVRKKETKILSFLKDTSVIQTLKKTSNF